MFTVRICSNAAANALYHIAPFFKDKFFAHLYEYTFANDNGENPIMKKIHTYVDHWPEAFKKNIGLLLFGDVRTGKSFAAGCIANTLLDQDIPVFMTNFQSILSRLGGTFGEDRTAFLTAWKTMTS